MTEIREDGNRHLCGVEMKLWGMVYTVALEWQTMIMFRWTRMNYPKRQDALIEFFVPKDSVYRYEIINFLKGHLDYEERSARKAVEADDSYFPGTNCEITAYVYTFNGLVPELPREVSEAMSSGFVKEMMIDLGTPKRKERAVENVLDRAKEDPEFINKLIGSMRTSQLEKLLECND